jgi:hypothetical protein
MEMMGDICLLCIKKIKIISIIEKAARGRGKEDRVKSYLVLHPR